MERTAYGRKEGRKEGGKEGRKAGCLLGQGRLSRFNSQKKNAPHIAYFTLLTLLSTLTRLSISFYLLQQGLCILRVVVVVVVVVVVGVGVRLLLFFAKTAERTVLKFCTADPTPGRYQIS